MISGHTVCKTWIRECNKETGSMHDTERHLEMLTCSKITVVSCGQKVNIILRMMLMAILILKILKGQT
jgi:hypothetical protein